MSGITYLSCIMLSNDRDGPPLGEAMLDIQTCAGVLEALTGEHDSIGSAEPLSRSIKHVGYSRCI